MKATDPTIPEQEIDILTTQAVVPDLIAKLYRATIEFETSSSAPTKITSHDPHLRLRRTLTPSLNKGIRKYNEAQFMIEGSTGKRTKLQFGALGEEFTMDAYVWGASVEDAKHRLVALHGISPGASRTRWHRIGERLSDQRELDEGVRFVALDWHSIDRTDKPQDAFLTMLPKHFWNSPEPSMLEDVLQELKPEESERLRGMLSKVEAEECPRGFDEAAEVLKAIIEQGLGWGTKERPFIPCIKSWSGGVGVRMLARSSEMKKNVAGAVVMHAAAFDKNEIRDALKDIPSIVCWAKDDPLVPYNLSEYYLVHDRVKLVTYEKGGHANFDGSQNLPNFDDEIIAWIRTLP